MFDNQAISPQLQQPVVQPLQQMSQSVTGNSAVSGTEKQKKMMLMADALRQMGQQSPQQGAVTSANGDPFGTAANTASQFMPFMNR